MVNRYFTALLATLAFTSVSAQDATPTIITEMPKGEVVNLYRSTTGYESFYGNAMPHSSVGDWHRMVFGEDGAVYIENPINSLYSQTWIKGTATENDTIAFQLPQAIFSEEFYGNVSYGYLRRLVKSDDGKTYVSDPKSQTLKYVWRDNRLTKVDDTESYIVGMCLASGSWAGYGEDKSESVRIEDNTQKPSSTATINDGLMLYMDIDGATQQYPVKYCIDGNTAWLGDLTANMKGFWVKGEYSNGECTFPAQSFIGIDTITAGYMYLSNVESTKVDNGDGTTYNEVSAVDEPIVFTLKSDGAWATRQAMSVHKSSDDFRSTHILDFYKYGQINPWVNIPGAPMPAIFTGYVPYEEQYGYAGVEFMLSYYSEEGNYLDPSHLYYNFYIDDERQTFAYPEYQYMLEPMTDVPFSYYDQYDFYKLDENNRRLYFYKGPKEKIGIEALYIDGDERLSVGITEYTITTDGVSATPSDVKHSVSIEYTDLAGRRVSRPTKGIYIRTVTYDDGTKESKKIAQ